MAFAADLALRLAAAGAGGLLTLMLLARLRPVVAPTIPPTRLRPLDLLAAAALLFALRMLGMALLGPPGVAAAPQAVLRLAGEVVLVLLFLRWRSGATHWFPARAAPNDRPDARAASAPTPRAAGSAWALGAYAAALPGLLGVAWLNLLLVERFSGHPPAEEILAGFQGLGPTAQVQTALLAALLMPLLEEMLFRGFLMRTLAGRREHGPVRALAFSTLVFALAHGPAMWLPTLVLGALLAWVDLHSGDLRRAVLIHVAHNALVLFLTDRVIPLA